MIFLQYYRFNDKVSTLLENSCARTTILFFPPFCCNLTKVIVNCYTFFFFLQ